MKLKELSQKDFKMKIIEDLGMKRKENSLNFKNVRYAIFECSICRKHFETIVPRAKTTKQDKCKSCSMKTHGKSNDILYKRYLGMLNRCYNKNSPKYDSYGGRGVTVADIWLGENGFENFEKWALENGFRKYLQIDKDIGSRKLNIYPEIYSPETCSFVTEEENSKHKQLLTKSNKTGYRGVTVHKNKFKSTITVNDETIHLGLFKSDIDAAKAYDFYILKNNIEREKNNVLSDKEFKNYNHKNISDKNKTGFTGVYAKGNKYAASINIEDKKKHIKYFYTISEANEYRNNYIQENNLYSKNKINI